MVVVQRKATLADCWQSPLKYARAFEKDYNVRFVDVLIVYILKDVMFSTLCQDIQPSFGP